MQENYELMELMKKFPGASITVGGSSVTYNSGIRIANSGITFGGTTIEFKGKRYYTNDASAVERMDPSDRPLFWSYCTDEAKNSELYRAFALEKLASAKIDLSSINAPHLKNCIINNAISFSELGKYCVQQHYNNWVKDFIELGDDIFEIIILQSSGVKKLLEGFATLNETFPIKLLQNIEKNYLKTILNQAYDAIEFLKGLKKIGYKDVINLCLDIELSTLQYLIKNRYEVIQLIEGLVKLGDNSPLSTCLKMEPQHLNLLINNRYESLEIMKELNKLNYKSVLSMFLNLPPERSQLLLENRYESFEIMKGFYKMGYSDPMVTFFSISENKLHQLLKNRYESFELMKFFGKIHYKNPLSTYLNIETATACLLLKNRYDAVEIMSALYKKGISDPLSYLEKLGLNVMITLFSNREEYVKRISRGVNIEHEFKPIIPEKNYRDAEVMSKKGLFAVNNISAKQNDNEQVEIPESYKCSITKKMMKNPTICFLDGRTYEDSAIRAWLQREGSAPMNQKPLPPHQSINDVLVVNHNLKEAIESFENRVSFQYK